MEANEWVYPPAQYSGSTPVLNQKSGSNEIQDLEEEEKDFLQLGQYNMIDSNPIIKIKSNSMSLAQTSSKTVSKQNLGHHARLSEGFFEDFSLDSMSTG
jgi:hypothetical protein